MKNTKSRKRILLSSVAMLLVALVALGSATYAWFTLNKTVNANNMKVEVAAAKGLVITGTNGQAGSATNWDQTYDFAQTTTVDKLNPASLDTASGVSAKTVFTNQISADGKWETNKSATGAEAEFAAVDTVKAVATVGTKAYTSDNYVAAYRIGVKTKDETTAMQNVALKFTPTFTGSIADYVRVAVVKQDAFATDYDTDDVIKTYGNETTAQAYPGVTGTAPNAAVTQNLTAIASGTEYTVETLARVTTPEYYTVLVWFEGEDADCTTTNANGTIALNFKFTA